MSFYNILYYRIKYFDTIYIIYSTDTTLIVSQSKRQKYSDKVIIEWFPRLPQSRKKSEFVPQQNPLVETLFRVQLIRYSKKQIPPFGSFRDLRMRSPVFALRMRESEK